MFSYVRVFFNSFWESISFNCLVHFLQQAYGRDLMEAQDWCRKYMRSGNVKDLTQAWDLYYHVFRRISKQLPQVSKTSTAVVLLPLKSDTRRCVKLSVINGWHVVNQH